jgi:NADH:ubiquinone oxidoreductase subunit C
MNNEILMAFINENTNNSAVCSADQYDMLNVNIKADQLIDLVGVLKNEQGFIYLTDICAAHYPEKVGAEFEVIESGLG